MVCHLIVFLWNSVSCAMLENPNINKDEQICNLNTYEAFRKAASASFSREFHELHHEHEWLLG